MSLREWIIDGIFTLTVDNASSNLTTIKFLQRVTKDWNGAVLRNKYMHMRCCAHIINLIVGEGLKEIDASVAKVREAVRWNSIYIMLETAENFEIVFLQMDFEDDGYSSYFRTKEDSGGLGSPCMTDFQNCRAFVTFLRLFYNATKKFSSSLYVTSNAFYDEIFVIQEIAKVMVDKVKDLLFKLYNFCTFIHSPNVQDQSGSESTELESDASDPYVMVHSRYERFLQVEKSVGYSNELERYLAENCDSRKDANFEILEWWRDNCNRYQVLSKVVKDMLAVPVSTVASESAFSTGGRIVDPFRSSLSPLMVQNLVCSQNWLQATVPISHRQSRDDVEALEEELLDLVLNQQPTASATANTSSSKGSTSGKRPLISIDD
ncbi:zinc finger BED domain-containing protein RICESLEEPER 2-like [Quercus robur]|uniref:zinc finger BED domain-containing protein RICESLEEPER 2-like n=1 Tax=Quercus robur TaxID=38942 RepID=UPI002163C1BE|nr:zinc finger BED domain-containing protein RICESLEEPER 2-like [Quercus robur]